MTTFSLVRIAHRARLLFLVLLGISNILLSQEPIIRVRIMYTLDRATMIPQAEWQAQIGERFRLERNVPISISVSGTRIILTRNGVDLEEDTLLTLRSTAASAQMKILNVPFGIGWWWAGIEDRLYEGTIEVRATRDKKLSIVVILPLEQYLSGVVPFEIGSDAPMEALKAQTVAARSETIVGLRSGIYAGEYFDICADVECQVYGGVARRTPLVEQAIRETRALVLMTGFRPVGAYYASNCGGHSESVENVFPERSGPQPYWSAHPDGNLQLTKSLKDEIALREWLASEPDVNCNAVYNPGLNEWSRRNFRWKVVTSVDTLSDLINTRADIGRIVRIDSIVRGESGRILNATFVGERGSWHVKDQLEFRQIWAPPLRSSCVVFDVEGPAFKPTTFTLTGAGWGHGVGMCQSGAVGMALKGKTFREILAHYYRTAEVKAAY
jgi:stage II sporulation protein D